MLPRHLLTKLIRTGLAEDIGAGDVTTGAVLRGDETGYAQATAKTELVVAGIDVFGEVFLTFDPALQFTRRLGDGEKAGKGDLLAEVSGSLASILTAERVALNLFQRMCGIATLTRRYVERIEGTRAKILDTRKTVPGLRFLDKYAVRVGGGCNHRFALYDGVLIKDNHITAAGGIAPAVRRVRERVPHTLKIEVEVKNLAELEEALAAGADAIMLDNMGIAEMAAAVKRVGGMIPLEASGNMTLERVREVAAVGVDFISVGALTHSVAAADVSLNVIRTEGRP
ncbi:MAG: carboxylating nicotinate-nucleotide diphosphorylase [Proteobacteria bacterium]|nr:carboxylating nicotinate-nucleotide diphosphorylase [Pseudomonadota bacterium]MBU2261776.1 carboxylating nicotinate-nucleotide diphosphorylase [Pseudomonadota bacterium]